MTIEQKRLSSQIVTDLQNVRSMIDHICYNSGEVDNTEFVKLRDVYRHVCKALDCL